MPNDIILSMRNISKSFPGVRALHNVDFTLYQGEIHALMGENGAGKSTLIKVLTGVYPKDGGQVFLGDMHREISVKSPQEAQNLGISTVYQEITLCPNLSVAENLFIGRGNYRTIHWRSMQRRASCWVKTQASPDSSDGVKVPPAMFGAHEASAGSTRSTSSRLSTRRSTP